MLLLIPTYVILFLKQFFVMITKYTVLDERRHKAKERKSQRRNPCSITRCTILMMVFGMNRLDANS